MLSKAGADLAARGVEEQNLVRVQAIAELRHPHLVVMRASDDGGYEAEIDGGKSLAELEATRGPLPLRAALRILLDAMSGLSALHRARLGVKTLDFVHGEVTPDNIVVGKDGVARLVPLVETHWSSTASSSPEARAYAAPEKLLGDAFDQRADVFSAGVLLWEAMMGRSLFGDQSVEEIVTQLVGGKVPHPKVAGDDAGWSSDLAEVVMRALAVDPADRWAHVGIMGADIETIAEGRMAKSSDLVVLVTGRDVSRDSLSDEVTRPLSAIGSLTPLAASIPAPDEPTAPDSPGAFGGRRSDSIDTITTAVRTPASSRVPMAERRRRQIFGGALAGSFLLLGIAGMKALSGRPEPPAASTVLASGAEPTPLPETPAIAPEEPAEPVAPKPVVPVPAPIAEVKGSRAAPKASAAPGKTKPKEDPFGLMRPVRTKPKDDAFGL